MKNFHLFNISQSTEFFLLLNLKNMQLKTRAAKICDARYTFNKVLGHFPFLTKESQMLICPNFLRNTRVQCLLETFNTWIKLSDTGVNFWEKRLGSSKLYNRATLWFRFFEESRPTGQLRTDQLDA